jgi:hypothetical protein
MDRSIHKASPVISDNDDDEEAGKHPARCFRNASWQEVLGRAGRRAEIDGDALGVQCSISIENLK